MFTLFDYGFSDYASWLYYSGLFETFLLVEPKKIEIQTTEEMINLLKHESILSDVGWDI